MDDAIILPIFMATVYLSRVNLSTVHRRNLGGDKEKWGIKSFV